ncbi:hypothetical protein WMY93_022497 [Mugilogobius chulae]|uniref:Uncharacterized protein n=1 Tax=Mugilogobius chulae TaxID=88201 RepID=A0AAW0NC11_9GOBI
MVQHELNQAQDEIKQLKCDLTDQQNKHQEEKFKLLNQTKHMIEAHKAERDKQNRYVQEIQSNLDCVTEDNRALLQESERLHSQLKSQDVAIECLRKQLTEAENESLQKSENWESAKQTLLKEKEEVQSKLARSESQTNLLLKKMTQIQLGMNNVKIEMSEVMKSSDELRDKLRDQTQQKVLLEDQIKHRDQLVQQLKDEIHQSEIERHLLEEQVNHRDQLVQQLKDESTSQPQRPTGPTAERRIHQSERERHLMEEQVNHRDQLVQKLRKRSISRERAPPTGERELCTQTRTEERRRTTPPAGGAEEFTRTRAVQSRGTLHLLEKKNLTQDQELGRAEEQRHQLERMCVVLEQRLEQKQRKWYRRLLCC